MDEGRLDLGASERRVAPRSSADAAGFVAELYDVQGKDLLGIARLSNLSEGGACIESASRLSEMETCLIRILLGRKQLMAVPCQVVWSRHSHRIREYGVRFSPSTELAREVLKNFIREYFESAETGSIN